MLAVHHCLPPSAEAAAVLGGSSEQAIAALAVAGGAAGRAASQLDPVLNFLDSNVDPVGEQGAVQPGTGLHDGHWVHKQCWSGIPLLAASPHLARLPPSSTTRGHFHADRPPAWVQTLRDIQSRFEGSTMAVQDTWRYVAAAGAAQLLGRWLPAHPASPPASVPIMAAYLYLQGSALKSVPLSCPCSPLRTAHRAVAGHPAGLLVWQLAQADCAPAGPPLAVRRTAHGSGHR